MSNLINVAAGLMDGGDDLTVITDHESGHILYVAWTRNGEHVEYLRGMVEVITESLGLSLDNKSVIYQEILDRLDTTTLHYA